MKLDYAKYGDGLVPAIVQDDVSGKVLMLGFMNEQALQTTMSTGKVTFFSRTKNRLWTKGEESGNFLEFRSATADCDSDTVLIKAHPLGPVCHTGADTCFNEENADPGFLTVLEKVIEQRSSDADTESYTAGLFRKGINTIAQKVGEEAIELVIEAKDNDNDRFLNEAADLLFHYLVLLRAKGFSLEDVSRILKSRHKK
jgi:phosphoribosyl-AMP cyclohydrolase / phosphoribosyl-ATP pyrophosphohydrolase